LVFDGFVGGVNRLVVQPFLTHYFCDVNVMTNIIGIGSRAAGLSAYLASLAYHKKHQVKSKKVLSCEVTPIGNDANNVLIRMGRDVLSQGLELSAEPIPSEPDEFIFYNFIINIERRGLFWQKFHAQINFYIQNTPDDVFRSIKNFLPDKIYNHLLTDCQGYLLVIDGTSHREDEKYADLLEKFTTDLTQRNPQGCPIAFTVTKCDLSELWVNRDDPRGLVQRRFPKMYEILENWTQENKEKVEYFTTSSFGVFGKYCEPNSIIISKSKGGTRSVIRNPKEWQPFGLIEPLYWLCTGKML
jgi:GTPase SAR1 family protein